MFWSVCKGKKKGISKKRMISSSLIQNYDQLWRTLLKDKSFFSSKKFILKHGNAVSKYPVCLDIEVLGVFLQLFERKIAIFCC